LVGRTITKYEILDTIGKGGMAAVYLGYQRDVDRQVAVKVLPPHPALDSQFVERFQLEARTIARLQHPHILPLYDYGVTEDNIFFLVMPYINGGALDRRMAGKSMPLHEIERILREVSAALDYAHRQGVIHRDIKPANILLDREGNTFIADFGIAKLVGSSANLTGTGVVGTPAYMSPEQAQGTELDARTDIYSLGVVIWELLVGKPPFQADTPMQIVLKHINETPPDISTVNPSLPPELDDVMARALTKDPSERYQTAIEFTEAFRRVVRGDRSAVGLPRMTAAGPADEGVATSPPTTGRRQATLPSAQGKTNPQLAGLDTGGQPTTVIVQGIHPRWIIAGFAVLSLVIVGMLAVIMLNANNQNAPEATAPPTQEVAVATSAGVPTAAPVDLDSGGAGSSLLVGEGSIAERLQVLLSGSVGRASYSTTSINGDTLNLRTERLTLPPQSKVFVAWLVNTETEDVLNLGRVSVDATGSGTLVYTAPEAQFLPGRFNTLHITLEDSADGDVPAGSPVYTGSVPLDVLIAMRALYAESELGWNGRALIDSALSEARFAEQHAGLAARSDTVAGMISHVEHTLNILRGGTADYDGSGGGTNPGTGKGLYSYLDALDAEVRRIAGAGGDLGLRLQSEAELLRVCVQNVRDWADHVGVIEEQLLLAESLEAVADLRTESTVLTAQLSTGVDQNENGVVEPFEGECGLQQFSEYGTLLATIDLFAVQE
jgi:serine/threonine-protein kinase